MRNHATGDCDSRQAVSMRGHVDPLIAAQVTPQMIERVRAEAIGGKISCVSAHAVAEEFDVLVRVVGLAAEMGDIRINNCDLGCF